MKQIVKLYSLSIILTLSSAFLFSGCSQKQSDTQPQSQNTPTTQAETAAPSTTTSTDTSAMAAETPDQTAGGTESGTVTQEPAATQSEPKSTQSKFVNIPSNLQFTVSDPDGNLRQSQSWFTGGPVVLNFWGTWCPPCRREVPALVQINNEFAPKGVKMVSLSYNDPPMKVKQFVEANGMNWEQVLVNQDQVMAFGIEGFPTTIFYTKEGKELGRLVGGRSHDDFHRAFSMLVN